MSHPLVIRDAAAADEAAWRGLWDQYLAFYKVNLAEDVTAHTWARILDPSSRVAMRVAEVDGALAGFAIHHFQDSTWVKTPDCYLEDLFLDATYRGQGIGRALIDDLIAITKAKGWSGSTGIPTGTTPRRASSMTPTRRKTAMCATG